MSPRDITWPAQSPMVHQGPHFPAYLRAETHFLPQGGRPLAPSEGVEELGPVMLRGPCGGRLVSWPVLGLSAQHGLKDHRSGRGCPSVKVEPALSPEVQELPGGSAAVGSSPKRAAPSTPLSQGGQAGPRAGHAGATPAGGPRTRHRHEPLLRTGGAGASRNSANPGEAEVRARPRCCPGWVRRGPGPSLGACPSETATSQARADPGGRACSPSSCADAAFSPAWGAGPAPPRLPARGLGQPSAAQRSYQEVQITD